MKPVTMTVVFLGWLAGPTREAIRQGLRELTARGESNG